MAAFLVFQLKAPLASFGASLGVRRATSLRPTRSAVVGLLCAALGIERTDRAGYQQIDRGLALAHAELSAPSVMTDFHTVQAPAALRGATRREQLATGEPNCDPTYREYLQNGHWLIALQGDAELLKRCSAALAAPVFTLYVGRKSCPLSVYTAPLVVQAETVEAAMQAWVDALAGAAAKYDLGPVPTLAGQPLFWDEAVAVAAESQVQHVRNDRRLSLEHLHFASNVEFEGVIATA